MFSLTSHRGRLPQADQPHPWPRQEQEPEHQDGVTDGFPIRSGRLPPGLDQDAELVHLPEDQALRQAEVRPRDQAAFPSGYPLDIPSLPWPPDPT